MRYPQVVVREGDGWLAKQLGPLAADHRWLVREPRTPADALALLRDGRPAVLLVQVDPAAADPAAFTLLADAHLAYPDVPAVAVSDVKLPDADRVAWTAALFDLGARYVLFPPLSRPVLEDVVSGLMAAAVRRTLPEAGAGP